MEWNDLDTATVRSDQRRLRASNRPSHSTVKYALSPVCYAEQALHRKDTDRIDFLSDGSFISLTVVKMKIKA